MKIKFKKIKKIPLIIAKHAFESCLLLFLFALLIGIFAFYRYNIVAQKDLENIEAFSPLDERAYNNVLRAWQKEDQLRIENNSYHNLFSQEQLTKD